MGFLARFRGIKHSRAPRASKKQSEKANLLVAEPEHTRKQPHMPEAISKPESKRPKWVDWRKERKQKQGYTASDDRQSVVKDSKANSGTMHEREAGRMGAKRSRFMSPWNGPAHSIWLV